MNEIETEDADSGFDLGESLNDIGREMGLNGGEPVATREPEGQEPVDTTAATDVVALEPPKSWAKEQHETWKTLPRQAQEYFNTREKQMLDGLEQYKGDASYAKQLREIITPYSQLLKEQGIGETDAVRFLFEAHRGLTTGSPEQRLAVFKQLAVDLGFEQGEQTQVDPALKQLQDQVRGLTQERQTEIRRQHEEIRGKANDEVSKFAADPANVYFNEVAKDMVPDIERGLSMKDAYERAVWANPVTRAKEQARIQTESAASLKANAKKEGETARRAKGVNVNGAETRRAPTEPKGKFLADDDMRETLSAIKARAH